MPNINSDKNGIVVPEGLRIALCQRKPLYAIRNALSLWQNIFRSAVVPIFNAKVRVVEHRNETAHTHYGGNQVGILCSFTVSLQEEFDYS